MKHSIISYIWESIMRKNRKLKEEELNIIDDLEYEEDDYGLPIVKEEAHDRNQKKKHHTLLTKKQKIVAGIIAGVILIAVIAFLVIRGTSRIGGEAVYVEQISELMGLGSADGTIGRYAGVVESQQTTDVKSDTNMSVNSVKVEAGKQVKKGDTLFTYDLSTIKTQLSQKQLEYDQKSAEIEDAKSSIKEYKSSRSQASTEREKLSYTVQIKEEENNIKSIEYQQKSLNSEIKSLEKATKNTKVKAGMDGIIKSVKTDDGADSAEDSSSQVTITIMATGSYRVKAKVNEQNVSEVESAQGMLVYSRVNPEQFWKGTKTTIDYDGTLSGTASAEGETADTEEVAEDGEGTADDTKTSTSYTFYVELSSTEGLLLGQHVYVETDHGQSSVKQGVWLDESYICDIESDPYVWSEKDGELKKTPVKLGEYDEELKEYEIQTGLKREDYVAFPAEEYKEGMAAERSTSEEDAAEEEIIDEEVEDTGEEVIDDEIIDSESDGVEPLDKNTNLEGTVDSTETGEE